jgi:hypothetical protein
MTFRVRSWNSACGICGGQCSTKTNLSSKTLILPCRYIRPMFRTHTLSKLLLTKEKRAKTGDIPAKVMLLRNSASVL